MTVKEFIEQNWDKDIPMQEVKILTGIEPKYKCKNRFLQKVLIRIFGYTTSYETRLAKIVVYKPEDFYKNFDGNITIQVGD